MTLSTISLFLQVIVTKYIKRVVIPRISRARMREGSRNESSSSAVQLPAPRVSACPSLRLRHFRIPGLRSECSGRNERPRLLSAT